MLVSEIKFLLAHICFPPYQEKIWPQRRQYAVWRVLVHTQLCNIIQCLKSKATKWCSTCLAYREAWIAYIVVFTSSSAQTCWICVSSSVLAAEEVYD
jgi:hypothetical protein